MAKTVKELSEDTRTEEEKKNELQAAWFSENEALMALKQQERKVKTGEVNFYNTAFNIIRDPRFFEEYLRNK
ncbi:MAG: hypothetical protein HZB09_02510 [Candidatus Yonathbacteria bacterium]|nr:hypothetical protein [Candidatus Yonathbacteria bacterium]